MILEQRAYVSIDFLGDVCYNGSVGCDEQLELAWVKSGATGNLTGKLKEDLSSRRQKMVRFYL